MMFSRISALATGTTASVAAGNREGARAEVVGLRACKRGL